MAWEFNRTEAVFIQIARRIKSEILSGKYEPDQQIPPVRQIAAEAAVNPNTVQKSLSLLEEEGLLYSKGTAGRFVTSDAEVLKNAREVMGRELVRELLTRSRAVGISKEELIKLIEEENADG